jgi:hypothetical protein
VLVFSIYSAALVGLAVQSAIICAQGDVP